MDCSTNDVSVNFSDENSELNTVTVKSSISSPGNSMPINPLVAAGNIRATIYISIIIPAEKDETQRKLK